MESLGIKVRNTARFFVLNPTSITYDFVWAPAGTAARASSGNGGPRSPFACATRRGTIAGGMYVCLGPGRGEGGRRGHGRY